MNSNGNFFCSLILKKVNFCEDNFGVFLSPTTINSYPGILLNFRIDSVILLMVVRTMNFLNTTNFSTNEMKNTFLYMIS